MSNPFFALQVGSFGCAVYTGGSSRTAELAGVIDKGHTREESCSSSETLDSASALEVDMQKKLTICGVTPPRCLAHFLCRVADVSFPFLEAHRKKVLCVTGTAVFTGMVLSLVALAGGVSTGELLRYMSWISLDSGKEHRYLGLRFMCSESADLMLSCVPLSELSCPEASTPECKLWHITCAHQPCQTCRAAASAVLLPVLISMVAHLKLAHGIFIRFTGKDAAVNKTMLVLSGFAGFITNLWLMGIYHWACVNAFPGLESTLRVAVGPGFVCLAGAAILALLAALLSLGLSAQGSGWHRQMLVNGA